MDILSMRCGLKATPAINPFDPEIFPSDMTKFILQFLDIRSKAAAAQTCKLFKACLLEDKEDLHRWGFTAYLVDELSSTPLYKEKWAELKDDAQQKRSHRRLHRLWFEALSNKRTMEKELLTISVNQLTARGQWPNTKLLSLCALLGYRLDFKEDDAARFWKIDFAGHAIAAANLGFRYFEGKKVEKNLIKAFSWLQYAAESGDTSARHRIGYCYEHGLGVEADIFKAIEHYQIANEQGNAQSQYNLGWLYAKGLGVTQDFAQAAHYYQLSAEKNFAWAQCSLGTLYEAGRGVAKNIPQAFHYYKLAADQGHSSAQYGLALLYFSGKLGEVDTEEGLRLFQLAADQGLKEAQCALGYCYMNGDGVKKDWDQAFSYFLSASKQECSAAYLHLALCYLKGRGTEKDWAKAGEWYSLAAEKGHAGGIFQLALWHIGNQNDTEALQWLHRLANKNIECSAKTLSTLYKRFAIDASALSPEVTAAMQRVLS